MSYLKTIEKIQALPHYRYYTCNKCGHEQKVYTLVIHGECERCGTKYKFRGMTSIGSEVEDVVDAVLEWLGTGSEFEDAMEWKRAIDSYEE